MNNLDYLRALEEGRTAAPGAANPYTGVSLALAKVWLRGYQSMLKRTFYELPSQAPYVANLQNRPGY